MKQNNVTKHILFTIPESLYTIETGNHYFYNDYNGYWS